MTFFQDSHTTVYQGDAREVLRDLAERSVQCVVTSPPYWGLRDYKLPASVWGGADCAHEWGETLISKANDSNRGDMEWTTGGPPGAKVLGERVSQGAFCRLCGAWRGTLGLEPTPELYVEHMVAVFREVRRVLRDDGTVWLNLGDSYASGTLGRNDAERLHEGLAGGHGGGTTAPRMGSHAERAVWGKPKDLVGIPWRVAFALQADGWWLRSDIVWSKPNPMPESVRDRPTRSHEYVFLLSKRERYYYDADAVREPHISLDRPPGNTSRIVRGREWNNGDYRPAIEQSFHEAGRNKRTVWEIPTQPYPDAHFATFPEALVRPCILAGTSERGACAVEESPGRQCGAPWERVTERGAVLSTGGSATGARASNMGVVSPLGQDPHKGAFNTGEFVQREHITTGWRPACTHRASTGERKAEPDAVARGRALPSPADVPCVVLDPFAGSGTTALVARKAGRKAILIELSEEYCRLIVDRIGQGVLL